jgi:uncharacterized protein YjiS (DUF1127 family)
MIPAFLTTSAPFASGQTGGFVARFAAGLAKTWRVRANRNRVRALLDLDDHLLGDIGLTRADVESALSTPWDEDASRIVDGRARRR